MLARAAAVGGLPEAPEDKLSKLEAVVKRRFEVHGEIKSGALPLLRARGLCAQWAVQRGAPHEEAARK